MQILKISLKEFKDKFPDYDETKELSNNELVYTIVKLSKDCYMGVVKDVVTKEFEFINKERVASEIEKHPEYEFMIMSAISDEYDGTVIHRNDDTYINHIVTELEDSGDELKALRRYDKLNAINVVLSAIVIIAIILLVLKSITG